MPSAIALREIRAFLTRLAMVNDNWTAKFNIVVSGDLHVALVQVAERMCAGFHWRSNGAEAIERPSSSIDRCLAAGCATNWRCRCQLRSVN